MKGMFAILGLLFAAYFAPLFGNEVPLVLEETIQLPYATSVWDVMLTWDQDYVWTSVNRATDSSLVYFGNLSNGSIDSLDLINGWPVVVGLFISTTMGPCLALGTERIYGSEFLWRSYLKCFQLSSHDTVFAQLRWATGPPGYFDMEQDLHVHSFSAVPPPPDQCDTLVCNYAYLYGNDLHSYPYVKVYPNILSDTPSRSAYIGACQWISETMWFQGHFMSFCNPDFATTFRRRDGWGLTNLFAALYSVSDYSSAPLLIYDMLRSAPVFVVSKVVGITYGLNPQTRDTLWIINEQYSRMMQCFALTHESSEQVLAWPNNRSLSADVIIVDDGNIWGQTSPLDSGYAEIKLIGRYHNETRRLAVRYGSEIRIYRFGDPIYTSADDGRPELPLELAVSAYPNPFNPATMIAFDLPRASHVDLSVYDLTGRQVQILFDERTSAGHHEIAFDGSALPSGIYFARLNTNSVSKTHKLVLIK